MTTPFNPDRYRHHLDGYDLPDDHKLSLMQYVWSIMEGFVDRAFGQSPEQMLSRDKRQKFRDEQEGEIARYENSLTNTFEFAADGERKIN